MAEIKNIHLLSDVSVSDLDKIETAAFSKLKKSGIKLKVIENSNRKVVIEARQLKLRKGPYLSEREIEKRVLGIIDHFFAEKKVYVKAHIFKQAPSSIVDPLWINEKMVATGKKLKEIAQDTGIDYSQLSSLVNGSRGLSNVMKAMFWYYFKWVDSE